MTAGLRIEIRGTVQGVGFRPWVFRVAHELGIAGRVRNHARGVTVEAFGDPAALDRLVARLRAPSPPAKVRELVAEPIAFEPVREFVIERSETGSGDPDGSAGGAGGSAPRGIVHGAEGGPRALSIPPDLATCPDCARELTDPADRRFRYAFTNCTACGPRFTIATGVPYDRPATTMAPFAMCPACQREYDDPRDRRFHAQPNACPVCGPRLALWSPRGEALPSDDPVADAAARIARGEIVAVKGLGGFHLACDAGNSAAVAALRQRKHRDARPFAVMVADLAAAHALAALEPEEVALLEARERPIVLVRRRPAAAIAPPIARPIARPIAPDVAPDTELIGLMLPYTPLHHLLLAAAARPLVMTSANPSDEPICADNDEAVRRLGDIADALLVHDRAIATRCDDSVARVIAGQPTLLRRSRGYVPRPIGLIAPVAQPVLAVGAQLKNACCVAVGDSAYLGPHVGDLDNLAALGLFESSAAWLQQMLEVQPALIAHDLHPGYLSTRFALGRPERQIGVQHHHAHVASAMAEHGLAGPVIGVAYDGTGWGTDGTAWGGEILLAGYAGFERLATFRPIPLAGGGLAIREPWRVAVALLDDAFGSDAPLGRLPALAELPARSVVVVRGMIRAGINAPLARGVGRLFDAIAVLGLGRTRARYEGELAVAWNVAAADGDHGHYPFEIGHDPVAAHGALPAIDPRPMVRAIVDDIAAGVAPAIVSARFHDTLVAATVDRVRAAVASHGRLPIVLTGGAFQNPRLAQGLVSALSDLDVHLHADVPPGDGGIALGQAVVADAIARR